MRTAELITESEFRRNVIDVAKQYGWMVHSDDQSARLVQRGGRTFRVRNADAGFPDVLMLHPRRRQLVVAELKVDLGPKGGARQGKGGITHKDATPEQEAWLHAFSDILEGPNVTVHLWRPVDLDEIYRLLIGVSAAS